MRDPREVLERDGLLRQDGDRLRTTPRWQAAMARSALNLQRTNAPWMDLRLPIVAALLERYPEASDDELGALAEVMVPVEQAELAAAWGRAPGTP